MTKSIAIKLYGINRIKVFCATRIPEEIIREIDADPTEIFRGYKFILHVKG